MLTKKDMIIQAMARIDVIKKHRENIQLAWRFSGVENDITVRVIMEALWQKEVYEWMSVAMWGLTLDDSDRDRIKAAAYDMFLSQGKGVRHWLFDGENPGRWLAADEDEFRKMAAEAFSPNGYVS